VTADPDEPMPPAQPADGDEGLARRVAREREVQGAAVLAVDESRPAAGPAAKSATQNTIEWIAVVVGAIVIAVVVRTFVIQTFWIPSPSMASTLVRDDRVLVNKLSYKFHDVNRGDVIVFERPPNEPANEVKDLIKRVVGLPGDAISIVDGAVRVDGRLLNEPYVDGLQTVYDGSCTSPTVNLAGLDTKAGFVVPDGTLFVMGDNRVNSHDGRCFGPIDDGLVVGRAFYIMWPPSHAGGL